MTTTTRHTCNGGNGPAFGRRTPGCPRCDELAVGAPPVQWRSSRRDDDRARSAANAAHFASARHRDRTHPQWCGPVCTYGDW